ncbi:hypothetical protein OKW21_001204 [Catalinimonas alkaloidigena]|nr:hypothetical protein [Catalinimonas alkaloidigena]
MEMNKASQDQLDGPPFFKRWSGMYWLVIGNLVFLIILFYLLTAYYS